MPTAGQPYLLRPSGSDQTGSGTVMFSDYGKPVRLRTPPADQVLDLSLLGG